MSQSGAKFRRTGEGRRLEFAGIWLGVELVVALAGELELGCCRKKEEGEVLALIDMFTAAVFFVSIAIAVAVAFASPSRL